jgi:hypothetical protein
MQPLFLGSHPAMDFLNTTFNPQGISQEVIGDGPSFLHWMVEAKLLDAPTATSLRRRYNSATLDTVAEEARKLRAWATVWIDRWSRRPQDNFDTELRRLNLLLGRSHSYHEAVQAEDGVQLVKHEHMLDAAELLALVAEQIALLIAHEDPRLIRSCAGAACTLRFLDTTKAHRRLFCSAAACGNRAKVAAFRSRQRN